MHGLFGVLIRSRRQSNGPLLAIHTGRLQDWNSQPTRETRFGAERWFRLCNGRCDVSSVPGLSNSYLHSPLTNRPLNLSSAFMWQFHRAQRYEIQLPKDFECRDCTMRLIRQASEWGGNYRFWSCADVDIIPRKWFDLRWLEPSGLMNELTWRQDPSTARIAWDTAKTSQADVAATRSTTDIGASTKTNAPTTKAVVAMASASTWTPLPPLASNAFVKWAGTAPTAPNVSLEPS